MNLALTLVIQGVVFFVVAWAVMKFIWPGSWKPSRRGRKRSPTVSPPPARASRISTRRRHAPRRSFARRVIARRRYSIRPASVRTKWSRKRRARPRPRRSASWRRRKETSRESTRAREGLRQEVGKLAVQGASRLLRARDRPKDPCRAAGQIGRGGRAWLSAPPSPGLTRKRRSNTPATRMRLRSGRGG